MKNLFTAAIAATFLSTGVAQADTLLIRNANIYSESGVSEASDILVDNHKIHAIGKNLALPEGAREIDGSGKAVTHGFFNADTQLGIVEIGAIESTVDAATINPRITAALNVADALNPNSMLIPHNRMLGLTHALVMPQNGTGLFAGRAAIIHLGEGDNLVKQDVAMVASLGETGQTLAGGSRAAAMALLREALDDAKDYAANRSAVDNGSRREYGLSLMDIKALVPVVKGEMPLIVTVERAADIRNVLSLAKSYKLKLILNGASEGWMVAGQIAAAKVPVIMDPIDNLPTSYESLGTRLDNVVLLHKAGVELLFTGMGWHNTHNAHSVRQSAGNAVANGLPAGAAIAALTTTPAKVFGLNTGSLKSGSQANLVVWDGDPLEVTSQPELVIIDGREMPLSSHSTRLRDRYFKRLQAQ